MELKELAYKFATSLENMIVLHANNKGADQPAYPRSMISVFVIRPRESMIVKVATCQIALF